jgi:hypothetical protein
VFISELANTPFKGDFRFVCVDPAPNRGPLPSFLKKVPTLIIDGNVDDPLTDGDVMNWLAAEKIKSRRDPRTAGMVPNAAAPHGGAGSSAGGAPPQDEGFEPQPFMMLEMGAGTDSYSFLDQDTLTQGNGGTRMLHNYEAFGNGAAGNIQAQRMGGLQKEQQRSKKEAAFDAQMEAYQREREMGMPRAVMRQ